MTEGGDHSTAETNGRNKGPAWLCDVEDARPVFSDSGGSR